MESDSEREKVRNMIVSCMIVVCNEDKVNPVNSKWKWGEDELPIVDQCTHLGVDISKDCFRDVHIAKVIGKGKSPVGKMDAILTDPHLDTRKMYCEECDCTKVRVYTRSLEREREIRETTGNSADESS